VKKKKVVLTVPRYHQKRWETTRKGGGTWNKAYNVPEVPSDLKDTN